MGEEHKQHLLECLKNNYEITVEDKRTRYLGMMLEWDHVNRKVHLTMPGYVVQTPTGRALLTSTDVNESISDFLREMDIAIVKY